VKTEANVPAGYLAVVGTSGNGNNPSRRLQFSKAAIQVHRNLAGRMPALGQILKSIVPVPYVRSIPFSGQGQQNLSTNTIIEENVGRCLAFTPCTLRGLAERLNSTPDAFRMRISRGDDRNPHDHFFVVMKSSFEMPQASNFNVVMNLIFASPDCGAVCDYE
jgi:hypothetical protein